MTFKNCMTRGMAWSLMTMAVLPAQVLAAPENLSTVPATSAYRPAAPNVIVSVDDSGSMGAQGIAALQAALLKTFDPATTPDGSIRLGWQSMTNCWEISGSTCGGNEVRVLDASHRKRFFDWIMTLKATGRTPSHRMLLSAGDYLSRPIGPGSPWAAIPGKQEQPVLACRRAYSLFMTDGGWNDLGPETFKPGDSDSTTVTLPDKTLYDASSPETSVYRGPFQGKQWVGGKVVDYSTTFADVAFKLWSTDLQPDIPDKVRPLIRAAGPTAITGPQRSVTLSEYWNPKNDPATWQHLNLYTVGFNAAAAWNVFPKFGADTWSGEDYARLVTADGTWPSPLYLTSADESPRIVELWHAALNARGKFIPAPNSDALASAFRDVLGEILADRSVPTSSTAASARSNRTALASYSASYASDGWTGGITAYSIAAGATQADTNGFWKLPVPSRKPVSTADIMDAKNADWPGQRVVLSASTNGAGVSRGIGWRWHELSPDAQAGLRTVDGKLDTSSSSFADGLDRLNYLRGDRTRESSTGALAPFRQRKSRQGDIVNSKLWYLAGKPVGAYNRDAHAEFRATMSGRADMLYVGGNDGMLHGFDAATGEEKIAYVPEGLHPVLSALTKPAYQHRYFVDGSPLSGDVYLGGSGTPKATGWRTYLAGFPGAGGRGYFVLDVTDPTQFSEANANSLVVLDRTAATVLDDDVGQIMGEPVMDQEEPSVSLQITKMNNGRWALVIGNGVNSKNEAPVLLVQYLDGNKSLRKLQAGKAVGQGNGLAMPRLIDLDGNGTPELAYAGDLKGNLWRFDLSDADDGNWKVSFEDKPLFTATGPKGNAQAIVTAPVWRPHPDGGVMVAFGTGRSLTNRDAADLAQQTLYGIYDPLTIDQPPKGSKGSSLVISGSSPVADGRKRLVEQTTGAARSAEASGGASLWTTSRQAIKYTNADGLRGWYLDLPDAGERALENGKPYGGNAFTFGTEVPPAYNNIDEETCDPPALVHNHYYTTLDIISGSRPTSQVYAYAPGTNTNPAGADSNRIKDVKGDQVSTAGPNVGLGGAPSNNVCIAGGGAACQGQRPPAAGFKRTSWRQLQ